MLMPMPSLACAECVLGCGELIKYAERERHEKNDCTVANVACLAKDIGCKFLGASEEIKAHEAACVLLALRGMLHEQQDKIKALQADVEMLKHAMMKTNQYDEPVAIERHEEQRWGTSPFPAFNPQERITQRAGRRVVRGVSRRGGH
jgi:hypothetical protein